MPTTGRPPLPRAGEWSPPTRSQSSPPLHKPSRTDSSRQEEDALFNPPPDLVCPISHEVFSDPVINSAGQVYERKCIQEHLARHNTDPITGSRLTSKVLTPVYFLKSRAAEFREAAARDCVERATAVGTRQPIKYVRRAAELCEALAAPVPGLSQDCQEYIKAHPSNVYDMPALHLFARGLLHAGQRDKAAAVYFTLLQEGADRAQQAGLLRQCLACWNMGAAVGPAGNETGTQDAIEMLVSFVEQSEGPSAVQIVDIAQEAKLDHAFIAKFCESLLFRQGTPAEAALTPREWTQQKQILLKYVQMSCTYIAHQQAIADTRMAQVMENADQLHAMLANQGSTLSIGQDQRPSEQNKRGRLAAAVCLVATSLVQPESVAVRIAKAASMLAVVHFSR